MRKRILCMLLAVLMLLSLIPSLALPSQAAANLKLSEVCVEILKEMEGFAPKPYYDNGHYSVGYGSSCDKNDYPNGITKEEADALMRTFLGKMEDELNKFASRQKILFSQNQFDALMLFTYNCGSGWLYGDGDFRQAVIDNTAGNDFIYWSTQWSYASGELLMGLVNRRLIESAMYLNGNYTNEKPSNYSYVLYDNNGVDAKLGVQGFDCNLPACVKPVPVRDGYQFLGWYTAENGGAWITELTSANAEQTLYAHWQANGTAYTQAATASYRVPADMLVSLDVYDAPGGNTAGALPESGEATICADYLDESGTKWGCLAEGGWVKLGNPRNGTYDPAAPEAGISITVTGDYVNVRVGPGTKYDVVSGVKRGDKLVISEVVDVDGTLWGRFRGGWICLQFTDYSGGLTPGEPEDSYPGDGTGNGSTTAIATGVITVDMLNIRSAAGTASKVVGCYTRGNKVEILEKVTVGGTPWGRTDKGWICLSFVKVTDIAQTPETSAPTEPESSVPETTLPGATEGEQPKPSAPKGIPATVISKGGLIIRAGAGTNFKNVGAYGSGEKIEILEQKTVNGVAWGRTDKGWVCMQYVRLAQEWTNASGVYGVVTSRSGLIIRAGAGVGFAPVGSYGPNQRIVIVEQKNVSGVPWGRTDKGWVCMSYVRLEQMVPGDVVPDVPETTVPDTTVPETTVPEVTEPAQKPAAVTGTITASALNIRDAAGTNSKVIGAYHRGDRVTILEQVVKGSTTWGRTDKGWISLSYVKLDEIPITPDSPRVGMITASSLCIRKGPGTGNAIVGTYLRGDMVTIFEAVKVGGIRWGRTAKGWICMDYVQLTASTGGFSEVETTVPVTETENPGDETVETPGTEATEAVPAFDFTYEEFVSALNTQLEECDAVAKRVNSEKENILCYEFTALSDEESYGVIMYIEVAENGRNIAAAAMVCNAENEVVCENLAIFATFAMLTADETITEEQLEKMLSESKVDDDGNQYYIMERESGQYIFVIADNLLQFHMRPVSE